MKSWLRKWLNERQFNPGYLGVLVNPFFLARRGLWCEIERERLMLHGRLLDVGCGSKPYEGLFPDNEYVGLEFDTPMARARGVADAYYDGKTFPFPDESFDSVLCNQVLEHVFTPDAFLSEIRRILKPEGKLLLTVPFVWDEHEQPYDFARYTSFGLRSLLEKHGFVVLRQRKILPGASVIFQLLIAYLYKVFPVRRRVPQLVMNLFLFAPISLLGLVAGRVLPGNQDLFLDQLVVAERLPHVQR